MDAPMTANGQPKKVGHRFEKGHRFYPPRHLSPRQQRKIQYAAISKLNLEMSRAIEAGEKVNPVDFTRSIHLQMMMEREL
jgi:hypothetical protein